MTDPAAIAPDPRRRRQLVLARFLRVAGALSLVLAVAGLVPGDAGRIARGLLLAMLIATPLVRALWLALRWARRGDVRFASVAIAVVAITCTGAFLA